MATATLNPFITSISGRIGSVVFYHRQGKVCIRTHVIPHNPDTKAQRIVRRTFTDAVKSWQSITQDERYKFNRRARSLQMSGYNLYISGFMTEHISVVRKSASELNSFIDGINPSGNMRIFPSVSPSYKAQFTKIYPFKEIYQFRAFNVNQFPDN